MRIFLTMIMCFAFYAATAQGCSDAGVCTIGDFNAHRSVYSRAPAYKNEIDISFTYGTHRKNERFYQPQINFRHKWAKGSFVEFRLPLSIVRDRTAGISTTGIGDLTATYNNKFNITKKIIVKYAAGARVSFTNADKSDGTDPDTYYPMYLQSGLGTTDLLAALSCDLGKYFSVGTGVQWPVLQYNKHRTIFYASSFPVKSKDYRRKPDALLKLTGHYAWEKLKINAGALAIFHLADDYYYTMFSKFYQEGSKGVTLNWNVDISYAISKKWMLGILYAQPFQTRKNIPDGLARSLIVNPRITYAFK